MRELTKLVPWRQSGVGVTHVECPLTPPIPPPGNQVTGLASKVVKRIDQGAKMIGLLGLFCEYENFFFSLANFIYIYTYYT